MDYRSMLLLLRIIKKTRTRCAQGETKRIVFFFPESSNPTFDIDIELFEIEQILAYQ